MSEISNIWKSDAITVNDITRIVQSRSIDSNTHDIENSINTIIQLSKETASALRMIVGCINT